jgi:hypothetical protein
MIVCGALSRGQRSTQPAHLREGAVDGQPVPALLVAVEAEPEPERVAAQPELSAAGWGSGVSWLANAKSATLTSGSVSILIWRVGNPERQRHEALTLPSQQRAGRSRPHTPWL